MSTEVPVHLNIRAPPKPAFGAACNGCGLCCAVELCPLAILRFRRRAGPCPALDWDGAKARYVCGVLMRPEAFMPWLPARWAQRLVARWIAAGKGCDCRAEIEE